MNPIIYYRQSRETMLLEELTAAQNHFKCVPSRMEIRAGDLVIPRYSALPFYKELQADVCSVGAQLINTHSQHLYVADLQNYVADLKELTPLTWNRLEDLPDDGSSFILKGATNSRKFDWNTMCFAQDKRRAIEIYYLLCNDGLIGSQEIYIRQYVPLKTYFFSIKDLPITEEYRFFVCDGQIISSGFYWSSHIDEVKEQGHSPDPESVPKDFLQKVIDRVGSKIRFYVIDVARTAADFWIVIELNDAQMSGISENNPEILYSNLKKVLC